MTESACPPIRLEEACQRLFQLEHRINEMQGIAASIFIFSGHVEVEKDDPLSDSIQYLATAMQRHVNELRDWHSESLEILRRGDG